MTFSLSILRVALHVLGAALFVGGTFSILVVNRALRGMGMPDAERRGLVRKLGRAAAPMFVGGYLLAAATGLYF